MHVTDNDISLARQSVLALSQQLATVADRPTRFVVGDGETTDVILPAFAFAILVETLGHLAKGQEVKVLPLSPEVTTQEAAEMLYVSRPFMVRLLEEGKIPFRKVGAHRRVRREDVEAYKQQIDEARHRVLDELQAQAQELGMGY
jgi:excisionase family DNA binding protein